MPEYPCTFLAARHNTATAIAQVARAVGAENAIDATYMPPDVYHEACCIAHGASPCQTACAWHIPSIFVDSLWFYRVQTPERGLLYTLDRKRHAMDGLITGLLVMVIDIYIILLFVRIFVTERER